MCLGAGAVRTPEAEENKMNSVLGGDCEVELVGVVRISGVKESWEEWKERNEQQQTIVIRLGDSYDEQDFEGTLSSVYRNV